MYVNLVYTAMALIQKKNAKFTHNDLQSLGLMVGPLSILVTESLPYNLCFFPLSIDLIFGFLVFNATFSNISAISW
jgi:hypothetical protein